MATGIIVLAHRQKTAADRSGSKAPDDQGVDAAGAEPEPSSANDQPT